MLIISKFHDFYDHVSQAGVDKHVVLQRKQEFVEPIKGLPRSYNILNIYTTKNGKEYRSYNLKWIFFCGKAYSKIESHFVDAFGVISDLQTHTLEEFEKVVPANSKYYKKHWSSITPQGELRANLNASPKDISTEIFRDLKVPYFAVVNVKHENSSWGKPKILLYPVLKEYTSYLNMDAYTVYQEIEMYCSGVLGVGEPVTIEVSDISKRDSKGFDQYSFKHRK